MAKKAPQYGWLVFGMVLILVGGAPAAPRDFMRDTMAGSDLTAARAAELENQVAGNPEDLAARAKLLGYYAMPRLTREDAREAAQRHILWLIDNEPALGLTGLPEAQIIRFIDRKRYAEAAAAWERQVKKYPDNTAVLNNAANFFQLDDSKRAEELWRRAMELEPKSRVWPEQLAQLYRLRAAGQSEDEARRSLSVSLDFFEKALRNIEEPDRETRFYMLPEVAMTAYRAGDFALAEKYAREVLVLAGEFDNWNTGNAVYIGNHVLGLVAFERNDLPTAKRFLLAAGASRGSPQLNSFGPNLLLAQKLLAKGEKETVLRFLDGIGKFWVSGAYRITGWKVDIQAGREARFGNDQY